MNFGTGGLKMEEKHLTTKEIKEFNKLISSLWSRINQNIDNLSWEHYATELYKLNYQESKEHDNFRERSIKRGITINEEAKYFSVLRLLQYSFNFEGYKPDVKDYLSVKKSLFYAYAIALNYTEKIKKDITEEEAKKVCSVSYTALI